ncbi:MAG: hypothetical protein CVV27_19930, partial [Candidatus Melainabacteria bacterium HGW-Melainabacteria-1]
MSSTPILASRFRTHLNRLSAEAGWAACNLRSGRSLVFNDRRFLAASTIKLPLLLIYAQHRHQAIFKEPYIYDPQVYCEDSPCFDAVVPGTAVSWDDIATWMMTLSDNTATNLLLDYFGLDAIQNWIQHQGFETMALNRRMMDLDARSRGIDNWTTPGEMMQLMARLANGSLMPAEASNWSLEILHRCEDREKIPYFFQTPIRVANKPGELPGIRCDVGYVHDEQHEIVMAYSATDCQIQ